MADNNSWITIRSNGIATNPMFTLLDYGGDWVRQDRIDWLKEHPMLMWPVQMGPQTLSILFPGDALWEEPWAQGRCIKFFGIEWVALNGRWNIGDNRYIEPAAYIRTTGTCTFVDCDSLEYEYT